MTAILAFVLSPIGRWVVGGLSVLVLLGGIYTKGRIDEHKRYKAKIERQINDAKQLGQDGRTDALKKLDDDATPPSWFRD